MKPVGLACLVVDPVVASAVRRIYHRRDLLMVAVTVVHDEFGRDASIR